MTADLKFVLNVDDDEAARYAKSRCLASGGFEVLEAATGHDAIRLVEELQPAVILLDVKLPDISGFEVCRRIKTAYPHVLVLQTSASFRHSSDRTRGLEAGADAYLVQPIESQELIASVRALMRISSAESALRSVNKSLEERVEERGGQLSEAYTALKEEGKKLASTRAQLVQAQKMEAVGQLTGGISHDFNNLLQVILGNLHLLERRMGDGVSENLRRPLKSAVYGAERAAILVNQLLRFSRLHSLTPEPLNLNDAVNGVSALLHRTLPESIKIIIRLAEEPPWGRVDPSQFDSAILNLAVNSRDAMPNGGKLVIETATVYLDEPFTPSDSVFTPGAYVSLSITDTGVGMTEEVLKRVCEPFFTTKEIGHGTGLGLSQVAGLADRSEGHLQILSKEGEGTSVRLFFPRLPPQEIPAQYKTQVAPPEAKTGKESVLVVEDEDYVREYVTTILSELGYNVIGASDATEALACLEAPQEISLIFADVGLRGDVNVGHLIEAAMQRCPPIRVLLTSGYQPDTFSDRLPSSLKYELLAKPFSYEALAGKVRRILDRRA